MGIVNVAMTERIKVEGLVSPPNTSEVSFFLHSRPAGSAERCSTPLRLFSREFAAPRRRCLGDAAAAAAACAVAVGLIDRKHVGVVGANRDAAAAKGDREYLHPVHTPAPLKPPGFPPPPSPPPPPHR